MYTCKFPSQPITSSRCTKPSSHDLTAITQKVVVGGGGSVVRMSDNLTNYPTMVGLNPSMCPSNFTQIVIFTIKFPIDVYSFAFSELTKMSDIPTSNIYLPNRADLFTQNMNITIQ